MLTVNHIITAGLLVFLIGFSPMSISLLHDGGSGITTIAYNTNQ